MQSTSKPKWAPKTKDNKDIKVDSYKYIKVDSDKVLIVGGTQANTKE